MEVEPPAEAALPVLTPCAAGWREVAGDDGVTVCEPWPEGGRQECAGAQIHLPGAAGCATLGSECPSGRFAEGLPAGALHVDPAAAPGGDGSAAAPLSTIADALSALGAAGGTIALSKGVHAASVNIDAAVTLRGACAAETRVEPAAPSDDVATLTVAAPLEVRDVTIGGGAPGLTVSGDAAQVTAEGVVVDAAVTHGVRVEDGAGFEGSDVAIRSTGADSAGTRGYAVDVDAAQLVLSRAELAENTSRAIYAQGEGAVVSVEDASIRDTRSQPSDGNLGGAMDAFGGVSARFTRTVFENNRDKNVRVDSEGTTLAFEDCVVRGGLPRESDDFFGFGVGIASGADATITRTLFDDNQALGVATQNEGTTATLTDVVIREVAANPADGTVGTGLDLQSGAHVTVERLLIAHSTFQGIRLTGALSLLEGADVIVTDTRPHAVQGDGGFGLWMVGARADLERVRMERNRALHVFVTLDAEVDLRDLVLRDGISQEVDGLMGGGLMTYMDGRATVTRALFEDLRAVALWSTTGGDITATDVMIDGVVPADCVVDTCADNPGGFGVVTSRMASASLTRTITSDTELCGLSIGETSTLTLDDVWVRRAPIGINVQNPAVDLAELQREIAFSDNGRNLDTSVLTAPDTSGSSF